ncbi:MAG: hypothetical protein DRJ38_08755 [Thermoprotei archaeon]|nr:MAG: hypothetical protein DRJ38_08755 [Thermoprotei archaeon]
MINVKYFRTNPIVMERKDWKYEVPVEKLPRAMRVPKEVSEQLKGIGSKKFIRQLKREAVNCPVLHKKKSFLECYVCSNFVRRIRGIVYCKGLPLEES